MDLQAARAAMIDSQVRTNDVTDRRLIAPIAAIAVGCPTATTTATAPHFGGDTSHAGRYNIAGSSSSRECSAGITGAVFAA